MFLSLPLILRGGALELLLIRSLGRLEPRLRFSEGLAALALGLFLALPRLGPFAIRFGLLLRLLAVQFLLFLCGFGGALRIDLCLRRGLLLLLSIALCVNLCLCGGLLLLLGIALCVNLCLCGGLLLVLGITLCVNLCLCRRARLFRGANLRFSL